jgi:uncharacterized protein (DUF433 family)
VFTLTDSASQGVTILRPYTGLYTMRDAARLFRATTPPANVINLSEWRERRPKYLGPSSRKLYSWIEHGYSRDELSSLRGDNVVIDFFDLVRLRMIVVLRSRGLSFEVISAAEEAARELTGHPQPFITEELWTGGSEVFVSVMGGLSRTKPGSAGQLALSFLRDYLQPLNHGLVFDNDDQAAAWVPSRHVLINPLIQFGEPCVEGTRVPTSTIWALRNAGDEPAAIAKAYGLSPRQVRDALEWEDQLGRAA